MNNENGVQKRRCQRNGVLARKVVKKNTGGGGDPVECSGNADQMLEVAKTG